MTRASVAPENALLPAVQDDRARVMDEIATSSRFLLVAHENPDGDALGSLVAMQGILTLLGKDSLIFMAAEEFPLPPEYRFFALDGLVTALPDDLPERTVVFLDCGNIDRNPAEVIKRQHARILNIDHHHDNTRFGDIDLVDPDASCTAEVLWDLMRALDLSLTRSIAEALYVGLVTDTGRFMYENTGPRAHEMAADLIRAGVDVHGMYRRLYEGIPFEKLTLLSRALASARRYDGGRLAVARLTRADYEQCGAEEAYSEGVIDHLRATHGTLVAALVRDRLEGAPAAKKVSLRSSDPRIDVSRMARELGGGGHRQAAGFTTDDDLETIVAALRLGLAAQL